MQMQGVGGEIAPVVPAASKGENHVSSHSHSQLSLSQTMTVTPTNLSPDRKPALASASASAAHITVGNGNVNITVDAGASTSTAAATLNLNSTDEESAMSSTDEPFTGNQMNTHMNGHRNVHGDGGRNGSGSGHLSVHLPLHVKDHREREQDLPPRTPSVAVSASLTSVASQSSGTGASSVISIHHHNHQPQNQNPRSRSSTLSSPTTTCTANANGVLNSSTCTGENDIPITDQQQTKTRPLHEQNYPSSAIRVDTGTVTVTGTDAASISTLTSASTSTSTCARTNAIAKVNGNKANAHPNPNPQLPHHPGSATNTNKNGNSLPTHASGVGGVGVNMAIGVGVGMQLSRKASNLMPTAIIPKIPPTSTSACTAPKISSVPANVNVNLSSSNVNAVRVVSNITTDSNDGEDSAHSHSHTHTNSHLHQLQHKNEDEHDKQIPVVTKLNVNEEKHAERKSASATDVTVNTNANVEAEAEVEKNRDENDVHDDELLPKVPLSFNLDVSSALDHVLNEAKQLSTQSSSLSISASNGAGGVKENGEDGERDNGDEHERERERPCILQQSKIGDTSSSTPHSGASSFCGDESSMDGLLNSANSTVTMTGTGTDEKSSVSVRSSMLVPEESLNLIAQMTIDPPLTNASPPAKMVATMNESDSTSKGLMTTKIKNTICSNDNLGKCSSLKEKKILKAPLISGTAAAQFEALARKNSVGQNNASLHSSQPLAPPPQLMNCVGAQSGNGSGDGNAKANSDASDLNSNHIVVDQVKRHENGMDMLAKITSHAVPIAAPLQNSEQPIATATNANTLTAQLQSHVLGSQRPVEASPLGGIRGGITGKVDLDQIMVPVGQSLSVYSAIAAQAGVTTHKPAPLPVSAPQVDSQAQHRHQLQQPQQQPQQVRIEEQVQVPVVKQTYVREIGKIRRYIAATGEFSEWEDLPCQTYGDTEPRRWCELNIDESIEIPLRRGGRLRVFPNFVADGRRTKVSDAMDKCRLYRQYCKHGDEMTAEARMQVLLSPKVNQVHNGSHKRGRPGYHYEGITMMAQPLSEVVQVEQLARDLAELYRLPEREWNIGTNLVYYRTGEDHMAWHSNCDQGEVLILCIVVESRNCTRPILIRPKGHNPLQDGDEEIIVFVGQGDAYEMDGQMQLSYEHCMPKKEDDLSAKRTVVVFRHGRTSPVTFDTGRPMFAVPDPSTADGTKFGHPIREIVEAKEVFDRPMLVQAGAHRHDKKWLNGTSAEGCESILVESQDPLLREDDGLCWLQVTCSKSDGGGALCQNYLKKNPVRVFRSSELESRYAPAIYEDQIGRVLYRYDGLYAVKAMWDMQGKETESAPTGSSKHTFLLTRCPKRPVDGVFEAGMHYNRLSLQEVWSEIQKRRGVRKPRVFQVPQPFMDLHPIGHKSNLTRRRKEIVKLPSDDCFRKPRKKKAKPPSPVFGTIADALANEGRNGNRHMTLRPKDEPRAMNVLSMSPTEEESDAGNANRPKRRSAAAARSYLQEAMQNKYGVGEREQPVRKRRSALRDDSVYLKRSKESSAEDDDSSLSADSDLESVNTKKNSSPSPTAKKEEEVTTGTGTGTDTAKKDDVAKPDLDQQSDVSPTKERSEEHSSAQKESSPKRTSRKKQVKASKTKEPIEESIPTEEEMPAEHSPPPLDHSSIEVGYRVNVDYRDVLFKATIRRIRQKEDEIEYLIHYDGNKKSNVHWIQSSMIHSVLSTAAKATKQAPKRKSKGGRKTAKVAPEAAETENENDLDSSTQGLLEGQKYPIDTELFVEYRKVLYRAVVRNARLKKNGVCEYYVHYEGYKKNSDRWVTDSALHEICDETIQKFDDQRKPNEEAAEEVEVKKEEVKCSPQMEIDPALFETLLPVRRTRGSAASQATIVAEQLPAITLDMGDNDPGVEFLPGSCVFVVRKDALYLAKMVKRRKRGKQMDYLVHFDGSSDNYDSWVPLSVIYEINPRTRRIFEQTADKREDMNDHDDEEEEEEKEDTPSKKRATPLNETPSPVPSRRTKRQKKAPMRYQKDEDDQPEQKAKKGNANRSGRKSKVPAPTAGIDMGDIDSGVDFLPGSTIFVVWKNALYLGKMLKKRGRGVDMEYFVHYDGFRKSFDTWVSVSSIYEINPQTKRIYNKQRKG